VEGEGATLINKKKLTRRKMLYMKQCKRSKRSRGTRKLEGWAKKKWILKTFCNGLEMLIKNGYREKKGRELL